jgi:hypothetical protein
MDFQQDLYIKEIENLGDMNKKLVKYGMSIGAEEYFREERIELETLIERMEEILAVSKEERNKAVEECKELKTKEADNRQSL